MFQQILHYLLSIFIGNKFIALLLKLNDEFYLIHRLTYFFIYTASNSSGEAILPSIALDAAIAGLER